jgi:transposase InsO family protein
MDPLRFILICLAGWMNREQQAMIEYLQEEVRVLREHIDKKRIPFSDEQRSRLARKAKKIAFGKLGEIASLVTPETLMRWHRRFVAAKYDSSSRRTGRPRIKIDINELIIRLANENRSWGYGSIEGALFHLGHDVSRSTIARVLKGEGIEPAPDRKKGMTWAEFLSVHWEVMTATDFFTTEIWTPSGLVRYHVLFVIRLATREVKVIGIIPEPHKEWMKQKARELTAYDTGFLNGYRYLIHDRASHFSKDFKMILDAGGVKTIKLPRRSPNLNAFAERWVRTAKELCVERMIFFGEQSLRFALAELEIYYNRERPHQGIGNNFIKPEFENQKPEDQVVCRSRLGNMLDYYYRKAA